MKHFLRLFLLCIIFTSLVFIPISKVFSETVQSNCVVTKIGNPLKPPVLPPECNSSGALPSADRTALLAKIKAFAQQGKITFQHANDKTGLTNGTGVVKRTLDGANVTIDTKLLRFYVYMVEQGYTFQIYSMIGTHPKNSSSSGNVSRHWDGHAVDIGIVNGATVNQTSAKDEVMKFMKTVNGLIGKELTPSQLLCAGAGRVDPTVDALSMTGGKISPGFTAARVGNHIDHIHVGF